MTRDQTVAELMAETAVDSYRQAMAAGLESQAAFDLTISTQTRLPDDQLAACVRVVVAVHEEQRRAEIRELAARVRRPVREPDPSSVEVAR